jgi:hypothetical protein
MSRGGVGKKSREEMEGNQLLPGGVGRIDGDSRSLCGPLLCGIGNQLLPGGVGRRFCTVQN